MHSKVSQTCLEEKYKINSTIKLLPKSSDRTTGSKLPNIVVINM